MTEIAGETEVHVNITPNGHGDCIASVSQGDVFVKPLERKMKVADFFGHSLPNDSFVAYLSHQNDNLRSELPFLSNDIPESLELVDELFGPLDAVK